MPSPKTVGLHIRIAPDKKAALAELANRQGTDTTKLVLPLIDRLLLDWSPNPMKETGDPELVSNEIEDKGDAMVGFRPLPGDAKMMKDYAARRGMKPSEFMKLLLRSWVSGDPVLPDKELNTLSNTLNELGEVGRNLNQITRRINSGETAVNESLAASVNDTLELVLRLKEDIRAVIKANIESWERDYAE